MIRRLPVYAKWNLIDDTNTYYAYDEASLLEWKTALEAIADHKLDCAILADIELTKEWELISRFFGTLDGNNHTISGLDDIFINLNGGTIKNLGLNVKITEIGLLPTIGTIAATNGNEGKGEIINCQVKGSIEVSYDNNLQIGGIATTNLGKIIACHSDVTINATSTSDGGSVSVGGIISNNRGTITASYFTGNISGKADTLAVGGIAVTNSSTISACYSTGILPTGAMAGGIAGNNSGTMEASYWSGDTTTGVANGDGSGATQVDGSSWVTPMEAMNKTLSDSSIEYEYVQGSGDVPLVIQPKATI